MITVNNELISEADIFAEMQYHPAPSKRQSMIQAAQNLIITMLLRQQAEQRGYPLPDSPATLAQRQEALIEQLLNQDLDTPSATDAECHSYYLQNPQRFISSPLLEVRHILLACPPDSAEQRVQAVQQAEQLLGQLQQGQSFAALSREFSACSTKDSGGLLGQISRGQTVPELERVLLKLPVGLHPHPMESRYGVHIVEVLNRADGDSLPYAAVKSRIRDYLNEKVRRKAVAQYIQQLISQAQIEGFDFGLEASPLMQ